MIRRAVRFRPSISNRYYLCSQVSLGRGKIDLARIQISGMLEVFQKLEGVATGFLYIQLGWIELSTDKADFEHQKDISQKIKQKSKSVVP